MSDKNKLDIIVATTHNLGIGREGKLPWHLPEDMSVFMKTTRYVPEDSTGSVCNAVLMGRKTYDSIPTVSRPLRGRINIVVSTTRAVSSVVDVEQASETLRASRKAKASAAGTIKPPTVELTADSFSAALDLVDSMGSLIHSTFVIGGVSMYIEALKSARLDSVLLTRVQFPAADLKCDCFLPDGCFDEFEPTFISKTRSWDRFSYDFVRLRRRADLQSGIAAALPLPAGGNRSPNAHHPFEAAVGELHRRSEAADKSCWQAEGSSTERDQQKLWAEVDMLRRKVLPPCPFVTRTSADCHDEIQYLDLVADIIRTGFPQQDRTGVGTLAKFGTTMRFDLRKSFPLLTTKAVFWKGAVEELLWFIRGDTNAAHLSERGVKIWDANGTREFLDSRGLVDNAPGDLGPVYGFQWRHFGAQYRGMNEDYQGQGVDQLRRCIDALKANKFDRRVVMSAWNAADLDRMALPPCHVLCQFFVSKDHTNEPSENTSPLRLSCALYQRSADLGLGVPFNIASYSLLCCFVAQICGFERGEFFHVMGNTHVYINHIEPLLEQLKRVPKPFPILKIDPTVKNIDDIKSEHIQLLGYSPGAKIPMPMAV